MKASQDCAKFLLQINAIKLNPSNPFTWASGLKSPIYCDNRKSLSYHDIRSFIKTQLADIVINDFGKPDLIAGVATGAIAQGALVADLLGLPFVYVRSEEKKHGLSNLIEGVVTPGQTVVIIEDLISTGQSSLKACEALREAGCVVKGMAAIFTYELPIATQRFVDANILLKTITSYSIMIEEAAKEGYVKSQDLDTLGMWKLSPQEWSDSHK